MAVLAYPFEVRDSANTTTDNRKTGLTPTVSAGKTIAASPATVLAATVTVVEITGGHYAALYDAETNGDAAFPVDCGSSLTNPNDRYITLDLTRDAGRLITNLDVLVSSRLPTTTYTAPLTATAVENAIWDATHAAHTTTGTFGKYLDAAISSVAGVNSAVGAGGFAVEGGSSSSVQLTVPTNTPVANWLLRKLYHGPTGSEASILDATLSGTTATVTLGAGWPNPSVADTAYVLA